MADLKVRALEAIQENNLMFFDEIQHYVKECRATLYNKGLDKIDEIKEALDSNKVSTKVKMRKKWYNSDNATLQVALMKLICSDDEAHRLNGSRTESKIDFDKEDLKKLSVEFINGKDGV